MERGVGESSGGTSGVGGRGSGRRRAARRGATERAAGRDGARGGHGAAPASPPGARRCRCGGPGPAKSRRPPARRAHAPRARSPGAVTSHASGARYVAGGSVRESMLRRTRPGWGPLAAHGPGCSASLAADADWISVPTSLAACSPTVRTATLGSHARGCAQGGRAEAETECGGAGAGTRGPPGRPRSRRTGSGRAWRSCASGFRRCR